MTTTPAWLYTTDLGAFWTYHIGPMTLARIELGSRVDYELSTQPQNGEAAR